MLPDYFNPSLTQDLTPGNDSAVAYRALKGWLQPQLELNGVVLSEEPLKNVSHLYNARIQPTRFEQSVQTSAVSGR